MRGNEIVRVHSPSNEDSKNRNCYCQQGRTLAGKTVRILREIAKDK